MIILNLRQSYRKSGCLGEKPQVSGDQLVAETGRVLLGFITTQASFLQQGPNGLPSLFTPYFGGSRAQVERTQTPTNTLNINNKSFLGTHTTIFQTVETLI
eukprot:g1243.t1